MAGSKHRSIRYSFQYSAFSFVLRMVVPKKNPVQNCCVKDGCSKDKSRSKLKKTYINIGLQSGLGTVKKWVGNKILFDIVEPA